MLQNCYETSTKAADKGFNMKIGHGYNWKHAPHDKLIYLGKKGAWHQFRKIGDPREVWCEVLDEDLTMLEETKSTT